LKSQLKNRRAYARKHGFLQDHTANLDIQTSGDEMDNEGENADAEDEEEDEEVDVNESQELEDPEEDDDEINDGSENASEN
jgi:hypothetical protein